MKGKISKQQWKYIFNISILVLVTITAFAFILKDNPNSDWFKEREEKHKECLNNAFGLLARNIRNMWD